MSLVEVKNVTKIYKGRGGKTVTAVDDLSFLVEEGEIVGFIGPNGAGKSTMIKIITGLAQATKGTVLIDGVDVGKDRIHALAHVGTIVENPDMYLDWTAEENLRYFYDLSCDKNTKAERDVRIDQTLKLVGLSERKKSKVRTFSLGMKQRLGIAQALLSNPILLVLDEPTNGLDPEGIKEIREILIHLASTYKMGVIVSSHMLAELQQVCSRFIIINKGKKTAEVTAEELTRGANVFILTTDDVAGAKDVLKEKFGITGEVVAQGKVEFAGTVSSGEIAKEMILAGINVLGLAPKEGRLEDVFMQITRVGDKEGM